NLLAEQVYLHPDKKFLLFEDENKQNYSLTYTEFASRVNRLSNLFIQLNIKKGDKVTIHLPNSLDFMVIWFALANIGAIMVPTNILSTKSEMEYILSHSESVILITEESYLNKFSCLKKQLPMLRNILLARYFGTEYKEKSLHHLMEQIEESPVSITLHGMDIAAMLYTSGTTSKPKGVHITHANYLFAGEIM